MHVLLLITIEVIITFLVLISGALTVSAVKVLFLLILSITKSTSLFQAVPHTIAVDFQPLSHIFSISPVLLSRSISSSFHPQPF